MEQVTEQKLQDVLRKIQALMAKAESTTFEPEADALRAKAEALSYRYRIDAAMMGDSPGSGGSDPIFVEWLGCPYESEYKNHYWTIALECATHLDCKAQPKYQFNDELDKEMMYFVVCGFPGEVRMAEALYTAAILAFGMRLEPKVNPEESDAENCYRLRSAGMEGRRIAELVFGNDAKSMRIKARKLFKEEAIRRGEDPDVLLGRGNSVSNYREDYANGFTLEIRRRLQRMRASRGQDSGRLVLAGRAEQVLEAWYERYPHLRPRPASETRWVDPREQCPKCARAKSGYCRDHQYLKPSAGRQGRAMNQAAYSRGRDAAQSVDLGPGGRGRVDNTGGPSGELG